MKLLRIEADEHYPKPSAAAQQVDPDDVRSTLASPASRADMPLAELRLADGQVIVVRGSAAYWNERVKRAKIFPSPPH